ncbi:MAG: four helix bundle protein [Candidatus Omnitrophica bacterium]|nr:four helix bundle protein [Candidatus Omnitrophota bacterium]
MGKIQSYEDLDVYQKLLGLHLEVHTLSLTFPKFELFELGSQIRRSSNSAPANIAEGWNNKHTNIYIEGINRAQGEINETKHHLMVAFKKKYLSEERYHDFKNTYDSCGKMLTVLKRALEDFKRSSQGPNTQHQKPRT